MGSSRSGGVRVLKIGLGEPGGAGLMVDRAFIGSGLGVGGSRHGDGVARSCFVCGMSLLDLEALTII